MKSGWNILFTFDERISSWEHLNRLIAIETCSDEPFFEDEGAFNAAVKDGWVTYQDSKTLIWEDGPHNA